MRDVNGWLMALSFLLGLVLMLAFTIRRVQREVLTTATVGAAAAAATGAVRTASAETTARIADVPSEAATTVITTHGDGPYGSGSAKAGSGGSGPAGWTIKGNEDSMLYHTTDSPWYDRTIAEVWFREETVAAAAGFTRWDKGRAAAGTAKFADVPAGPYGVGSAKAGAGGSGPAGWAIKGNEDSMLYHTADSPAYDATIAEVWFGDEETAVAAGFARWDSYKNKKK